MSAHSPQRNASDTWWKQVSRIPQDLADKLTASQLQWWKAWTKKPTLPPISPYTDPPEKCLFIFNASPLRQIPVPSSISLPPPPPPRPLIIKPSSRWADANLGHSAADPERALFSLHNPTLIAVRENDIILCKNNGAATLWLGKVTTVIGRKSAGAGTFLINVTWYDQDKDGKWKLRPKPSSTTQTYPTQVLLCNLRFNDDMTLPSDLQRLAEYVTDRETGENSDVDEAS